MSTPQVRVTDANSKANQNEIDTNSRLIPLTTWPQYHAWPTIGGLRHLVFFEKVNGFDAVTRRIGRRVLICEAAFFRWVNQRGRG